MFELRCVVISVVSVTKLPTFYPRADTSGFAEAGFLNKSSYLAPALGVTKFIIVIDMILITLCCST
jgi:hypothetical protein